MKPVYSKRRFFTSAHHHFVEVREAKNGNPFILVDQSTKRGGKFESQKLILFEDEVLGFIEVIQNLYEELKNGSYKSNPIDHSQNHQDPKDEIDDDDWMDEQAYEDLRRYGRHPIGDEGFESDEDDIEYERAIALEREYGIDVEQENRHLEDLGYHYNAYTNTWSKEE